MRTMECYIRSCFAHGMLLLLSSMLLLAPSAQARKGKVVVELKLVSFDSKGKDSSNDNCDHSIWGSGVKKCDPEFEFCLDKYSGGSSINECVYFKESTGHYTDDDSIRFGPNIKGMDNPIVVRIQDYEGIRFKVDVDDEDDFDGDDNIDQFDWKHRAPPARSRAEFRKLSIDLDGKRRRNKAELDFDLWVYCDSNSYGENCEVYCVAENRDGVGHWGCNPDTGAKYCLEGWEGLNASCLIRVDNCAEFSCANGATCVDLYDDFSCLCKPGFIGDRCETNVDECSSNPCLNNGECLDEDNGFRCECDAIHTGVTCELHVCEHPSTYCQNGGTCYVKDNTTVSCFCPPQYSGIHCDVDTCQILQCVHGTCEEGVCVCEPHWMGGLCDVRACDLQPCQSGGTCLDDGTCECPPDRSGAFCETQITACTSRPCMNGGECVLGEVNEVRPFRCICLAGFNGTLCDSRVIADTTDLKYDSIVDDVGEQNEESLPTWALGLVIAVAVLLLLIVLILAALLKYRRKYKKSVENNAQTERDNIDNFTNPMYAEGTTTPPPVSYSAGAESATVHFCTTVNTAKKLMPEEEDEQFGASPPPPYTQHADDFSKLPLPSYQESAGGHAFINHAFETGTNNGTERVNNAFEGDDGYSRPVGRGDTHAKQTLDDPIYSEVSMPRGHAAVSRSCEESHYAQVPAPIPVHTAPTNQSAASVVTDNELNATLEGEDL